MQFRYTAEEFNWEQYLCASGSSAAAAGAGAGAGAALFAARGHVVSHGFVCGMRLECADLMDPRLVCVATVARVVCDLLKVIYIYTPVQFSFYATNVTR